MVVSSRYTWPRIKEETIFLSIIAETLEIHMGTDCWKGAALQQDHPNSDCQETKEKQEMLLGFPLLSNFHSHPINLGKLPIRQL